MNWNRLDRVSDALSKKQAADAADAADCARQFNAWKAIVTAPNFDADLADALAGTDQRRRQAAEQLMEIVAEACREQVAQKESSS